MKSTKSITKSFSSNFSNSTKLENLLRNEERRLLFTANWFSRGKARRAGKLFLCPFLKCAYNVWFIVKLLEWINYSILFYFLDKKEQIYFRCNTISDYKQKIFGKSFFTKFLFLSLTVASFLVLWGWWNFFPLFVFRHVVKIVGFRLSRVTIFFSFPRRFTPSCFLVGAFLRKRARLLQWLFFFFFFVRLQSHSDWATFLTIETTKTTSIRGQVRSVEISAKGSPFHFLLFYRSLQNRTRLKGPPFRFFFRHCATFFSKIF